MSSYKYVLRDSKSTKVSDLESITLLNPASKGDKVLLPNGNQVRILEIVHGEFMSMITYAPENQTRC